MEVESGNENHSAKYIIYNLLFMQLRLYGLERTIDVTFSTQFEAKAAKGNNIDSDFSNAMSSACFISFVIGFIVFGLALSFLLATSTHIHIRKKLLDPQYHPDLASLLCLGILFSVYVISMDILGVSKDIGESNDNFGWKCWISSMIFVELITLLGILIALIVITYLDCCKVSTKVGHMRSWDEIKAWCLILAFIPPLVCFSSHIGFILVAWISFATHATGIFFTYLIVFVMYYVILRQFYHLCILLIHVCKREPKTKKDIQQPQPPSYELDDTFFELVPHNIKVSDPTIEDLIFLHYQKKLSFKVWIVWVVLPAGIILSILVIYFLSGLHMLPLNEITEYTPNQIFNFIQSAFVVIAFLVSYKLINHQRSEGFDLQNSITRYLKYFYKKWYKKEQVHPLAIANDTDAVSAITALFMLQGMKLDEDEAEYQKLFKLVLEARIRKPKMASNGNTRSSSNGNSTSASNSNTTSGSTGNTTFSSTGNTTSGSTTTPPSNDSDLSDTNDTLASDTGNCTIMPKQENDERGDTHTNGATPIN